MNLKMDVKTVMMLIAEENAIPIVMVKLVCVVNQVFQQVIQKLVIVRIGDRKILNFNIKIDI